MTAHALSFAPQQISALDAVGRWLKHGTKDQQVFRLFGYAGTGKTTIARHLAEGLDGEVAYAAFTGKAALMMQRHGCEGASTIHSLIYRPTFQSAHAMAFALDPDSVAAEAALIVVDECSMVDAPLARDLMSFGKPILVLGDPAQLPPMSGSGFFTSAKPDVLLTEIHRQARDNPIVQLATAVRDGKPLQRGRYGASRVISFDSLDTEDLLAVDQVLVGKNQTRIDMNSGIREELGRKGKIPESGDRLVCLRNDPSLSIFNGGLYTVTELIDCNVAKATIRMRLTSDDFPGRSPFIVNVRQEHFTGGLERVDPRARRKSQEFDYGYALTVHKAQGSQWPSIAIFDQSHLFQENRQQWLYTAITRAAERVTIAI